MPIPEVVTTRVRDPERLAAVRSVDLLDTSGGAAFDRATRLATRLLGAPVALVSIIDRDRQFFPAQVGLQGHWAQDRQTPLSHSFCQFVVAGDEPLVVQDARDDEWLRDNGAIADLGVIAYAGFPLHAADGQPIGAFCAIQDEPRAWTDDDLEVLADLTAFVNDEIRLRVALAASAEEARSRRNVLQMVAHDLRSPITSLTLASELLADGRLDPDGATAMSATVRRLGESTRVLLDRLLQDEAGDLDRIIETDLSTLAHRVVMDHSLGSRAGRLHARTHGPAVAAVDPHKITQLLVNLIDNAFKYAGPGCTVVVETTALPEEGVVELLVSDDGVGIPENDQDSIFEAFNQLDRGKDGIGLGLHIVDTIVREHGGTIDLESGDDGSAFLIRLPIDGSPET